MNYKKGFYMDSNDKFWLTFWFLVGLTVCVVVCVPTYIVHNRDVEMAKAGYVEKIIILRPATDWVAPITDRMWVKVSDEPIVEKK